MEDDQVLMREGVLCVRTVADDGSVVYADEAYIRFVLDAMGGYGEPDLWRRRLAALTAYVTAVSE